jgi:hypothetical protein
MSSAHSGIIMTPAMTAAISNLIDRHFPSGLVDGVRLSEGTDFAGDAALFIEVALRADPASVDASLLTSTTRLVRDALKDWPGTGFPFVSFLSAEDFAALNHAAA